MLRLNTWGSLTTFPEKAGTTTLCSRCDWNFLTSDETNMPKHYLPGKSQCPLLLYTSFCKTIHKTQYSANWVGTQFSLAVMALHSVGTLRCSKDMMLSSQRVFLKMETKSICCSKGENALLGDRWLRGLLLKQPREQAHLLPWSSFQFFIILMKLDCLRITELENKQGINLSSWLFLFELPINVAHNEDKCTGNTFKFPFTFSLCSKTPKKYKRLSTALGISPPVVHTLFLSSFWVSRLLKSSPPTACAAIKDDRQKLGAWTKWSGGIFRIARYQGPLGEKFLKIKGEIRTAMKKFIKTGQSPALGKQTSDVGISCQLWLLQLCSWN